MIASGHPLRLTRRRLLATLGVGLLLVLVGVVGSFVWDQIDPHGLVQQTAAALPRVEKALRATFPGYCSGANSQIKLDPAFFPTTGSIRQWAVRCVPDSTPWHEPFVDIDLTACRISRPLMSSTDWPQVYQWALDKDQQLPKLAGCP